MIRKLETIVLAAPTVRINRIYPAYKAFYERFCAAAVPFHPIKTFALPDVWVRDFLPVQNRQTGKLYQPFFNPCYANYTFVFTSVIRQAAEKWLPAPSCEVQIDGGNMIWGPNQTLFCLERPAIFRKSVRGEQGFVEYELKRATGAKKIVWLPRETGDKIGHIDGFMQFVGNTLLVSDERFDPYLKSLLERRLSIVGAACPNIQIRFLPCVPDTADKTGLSARGIYVNFLETSRAIFVPQYGLPQDTAVIGIMKEISPKPIMAVDCTAVSRYGGAIHCLTKEYV